MEEQLKFYQETLEQKSKSIERRRCNILRANGKEIFKLHDEQGLPLPEILMLLDEKGIRINVQEWMLTAMAHEWTYGTIRNTLFYAMKEAYELFEDELKVKIMIAALYIRLSKEKTKQKETL